MKILKYKGKVPVTTMHPMFPDASWRSVPRRRKKKLDTSSKHHSSSQSPSSSKQAVPAGYLADEAGPVPLVLDIRIAHDRVGSSTDPTLKGH